MNQLLDLDGMKNRIAAYVERSALLFNAGRRDLLPFFQRLSNSFHIRNARNGVIKK